MRVIVYERQPGSAGQYIWVNILGLRRGIYLGIIYQCHVIPDV